MKADLGSIFLLADSLKMCVGEIQDQHFCTDRRDKCYIDHLMTEQGLDPTTIPTLKPNRLTLYAMSPPSSSSQGVFIQFGIQGKYCTSSGHIHKTGSCSHSCPHHMLKFPEYSINLHICFPKKKKKEKKTMHVYHEHNIQGLMPPPQP